MLEGHAFTFRGLKGIWSGLDISPAMVVRFGPRA